MTDLETHTHTLIHINSETIHSKLSGIPIGLSKSSQQTPASLSNMVPEFHQNK